MKKIIAVCVCALFSTAAFSRQYIQCSDLDTGAGVVINLDGERSTLFQTNGVHRQDEVRVTKALYYSDELSNETHYVVYTNQGQTTETAYIPQRVIGRANSSFKVSLIRARGEFQRTSPLSCFSAIYEN